MDHIFIKSALPSVKHVGFCVEYHPNFMNQAPLQHGIDVVLLTYIASGRGQHKMQDKTFDECAGSLSITHYEQKHVLLTEGMDVFNIFLDPQNHPLPKLPKCLQPTLASLIPLHPNFYHRGREIIRFDIEDRNGMERLLKNIHQECLHPGMGHNEAMRLYMELFLLRICREAEKSGYQAGDNKPSHPMERLRRHLDEQYQNSHTIPKLAKQFHMHPSALCRAFKLHTGMTIIQYLDQRRLQAAMIQLRNNNDTILSICIESGFSDISRFNRLFRREIGMSPGGYRKQFHAG